MSDKISIQVIRDRKKKGPKLAVVTAYDATMAQLLDAAGVDILMVGDSLGMVVQGRDNTLGVTLEEMIYHCRSVARARPRAHVVCDLPFMSYQVSVEQAVISAGRLVKEGCAESIKLEGGRRVASSVTRIVEAGIPVMGHVGLTPQSVHAFGGFRVQGKTQEAARQLVEDARCLEEAGAYAVVVEGVPTPVAQLITDAVQIPTIGIGAGPATDGQVLVSYDLLGMYRGLSPKFVRRFAEIGNAVTEATQSYVAAVREGEFPDSAHSFHMPRGESLQIDDTSLRYGPVDEETPS